ncbi:MULTISPECIES: xanthine dehydrogenase family protein molybdopterin-binding subunit [unclassified Sphingomonas]|uniref:xanthine dehydrogenase family protein molybdopterin-binding subunit n=1 Tax=unclassified Sphingomonas TaxID=196159 RepID=UPI0022699AD7|nr:MULTISPECIES: xanthine dehydrogenase family protein molybdopterin-binding subunit [unclassified Sphingomonas]
MDGQHASDNADKTGHAALGDPHVRIDGPAKVCGTADFPGDIHPRDLAYGVLVTSPMARGRIVRMDTSAALQGPGVLDILTYRNVGNAVAPVGHMMADGWANSTLRPLASPHIHYAGQIVAVVVAETLEAAQAAALAIRTGYERSPHVGELGAAGATSEPLTSLRKGFEDRHAGDAAGAIAGAASTVEATYTTPIQHHNPIELPTTTCVWQGDMLTVYEPTRFVGAARNGLAAQLGIDPARIRVVAHFIGGHFGSKLALSQHTALAAIAARRLQRPVQIAVSRRDGFTIANHRTETHHAIRLGANAGGRFVALSHTATMATSRFDAFAMEGTDVSTAFYACPNIAAQERVARVDRNTPGPMRAPPEVPYLFALESAVDELAHAMRMDPIELRRRNDTLVDPVTGHPFTTRPLIRCLDAGAAAFGWADRSATPGATRDGAWLIGHGVAAAARPAKIGAAIIRVTQDMDGAVCVQTAHHEIGNGLYTLLAITASERLAVPLAKVTVELGDTDLPAAGISGGSSTSTTLVNALAEACRQIQAQPADAARRVEVAFTPPGAEPSTIDELKKGHLKLVSTPKGKLAWSFGAHFIEVGVHAETREIRVRRHVGAFAAGRILNPLTARNQMLGGMLWGQSAALLEETIVDPATGAYLNRDLADYLVPTAADLGEMSPIMVDDDDSAVNPEGIKGLGEIGIIGVNAAVANAVFNATGHRVRDLPIRLEQLL